MAWAFMPSKQSAAQRGVPRPAPSLRARAMRFLARREYSREELRRKLVPTLLEGEDLEAVFDDLAARGWLSDTRYAEHAIRARSRRFGPLRMAQELRARGVDEESIEAGFRAAGEDGTASIERVWASRFKAPPGNEKDKARQVRFLQARGFAVDVIFRYFKNLKESP